MASATARCVCVFGVRERVGLGFHRCVSRFRSLLLSTTSHTHTHSLTHSLTPHAPQLRYYLYNWSVPAELKPGDVGLVML